MAVNLHKTVQELFKYIFFQFYKQETNYTYQQSFYIHWHKLVKNIGEGTREESTSHKNKLPHYICQYRAGFWLPFRLERWQTKAIIRRSLTICSDCYPVVNMSLNLTTMRTCRVYNVSMP